MKADAQLKKDVRDELIRIPWSIQRMTPASRREHEPEPAATGCQPGGGQTFDTPDEHILEFDIGRHLGRELIRGMRQEVMDGYGMRPEGRGGYSSWTRSRLALSDEQSLLMQRIAHRMREQQWELRGRLASGQEKLRSLLEEPTPDPKAVGSAYAALSTLYQELLEAHLQAHNETYRLLTQEQIKEAEQQRRSDLDLEGVGHGYRRGLTPR